MTRHTLWLRVRVLIKRVVSIVSAPGAPFRFVVGLYVLLVVGFIWRPEASPFSYIVPVLGVVLTALAPDLTRRDTLERRVMIGIIALACGTHQYFAAQAAIRQQRDARITQMRDDIRKAERQAADTVLPDPADFIGAMTTVGDGLRIKAARLEISAALAEAHLLRVHPKAAASLVSVLRGAPEHRVARLRQLREVRSTSRDPDFASRLAILADVIERKEGYEIAARVFDAEIKPRYSAISRAPVVTPDRACSVGRLTVSRLTTVATTYRIAGVFNHIGMLSLICREPENAFAAFYTALSTDRTHVTVYESLAYALWILSNDPQSALRYVTEGRRVCAAEQASIAGEYAEARAVYQQLADGDKALASWLIERRDRLEAVYKSTQPIFSEVFSSMDRRFRLQYAYFSALVLENEAAARQIASDLSRDMPDSGDVQDSQGFVLMRFATSEADLETAERLFILAIENPTSGATTVRLASAHLQELEHVRARLKTGRP